MWVGGIPALEVNDNFLSSAIVTSELLPPIPTTWHTPIICRGSIPPAPKKFHGSAQSRQTWGMNTFWKKIQKEGTQVYKHKNIQITNVLVQVKCMINSVEHLLWLHRQLIAMPHVFNSLGRIRSIAIYWSCGKNYFLLFPILWFHNLHGLFDEHSCSCI